MTNMTKLIYKYSLTWQSLRDGVFTTTVHLPLGSVILKVGFAPNSVQVCIWAMVNYQETKTEPRTFYMIGTGRDFDYSTSLQYLTTEFDGSYVWHIFEKVTRS